MNPETDHIYLDRKLDYLRKSNVQLSNAKQKDQNPFPKLNLDVLAAGKRYPVNANRMLSSNETGVKNDQNYQKIIDPYSRYKYQTEGDSSAESNQLRRHNHVIAFESTQITQNYSKFFLIRK